MPIAVSMPIQIGISVQFQKRCNAEMTYSATNSTQTSAGRQCSSYG